MARVWLLCSISLKNIFRNKRRTILTIMILILGTTGLVLVGGFFNSLNDRLRAGYIYSVSGNLQISKEGYFEKGSAAPLEFLISDYSNLRKALEREPEIRFIVPVLKFGGMLSTEDNSVPVFSIGVDPNVERKVSTSAYPGGEPSMEMLQGEYLVTKDPYGIIISEDLGRSLGLKTGDRATFLTTRRFGAIDGAEFHIKGIFRSALQEVGARLIKMPMATAQSLLGVPDQIHSLNIILNRLSDTYLIKAKLEKEINFKKEGLEIIPWEKQGFTYKQSSIFLNRLYRVIQIMIGIVFILSIANTINMTIFERMREYGTMMAIGNSRGTVVFVVILEACILGFFGSILGIFTASIVAKIISLFGIKMPPPPLTSSNFPIVVMILLSPKLLIEAFLLSFLATVSSSIVPGYRASHMAIIQALGYV